MMPISHPEPPYPPPPGEPPYLTKEEAVNLRLGWWVKLRRSYPTEGGCACGPEAEVIAISNCPHSQTGRVLMLRDKRERMVKLDAAWVVPELRMNPFYEP